MTGVPSGDDSRYRVEHLGTLPAATAAQTDASLATARALAARLGVTLHPADGARTWEDPSWIALQGPAPERPWAVQWQVVTWGEDGAELRASGDASVSAPLGPRGVRAGRAGPLAPLRAPRTTARSKFRG